MVRSGVAIVIPARNEEATIADVVASVRKLGTVIVVDDASSDDTGRVAEQAGAFVVRNAFNIQYDASLGVGLNLALARGHQFAITMDADGQHQAADVTKAVVALAEGADIVSGIRPRPVRVAERLSRLVGRCLWGLNDPMCGLKGYRLSWLKRYGNFDTYSSVGTELALKMVLDGALLYQLNIAVRPRIGTQPRFDRPLKANLKILRALLIGALRYGRGAKLRSMPCSGTAGGFH
jgi:glycosyltransferase involved in cell wall biosynthesis